MKGGAVRIASPSPPASAVPRQQASPIQGILAVAPCPSGPLSPPTAHSTTAQSAPSARPPRSTARRVSSTRVLIPSLVKMCFMWVLTVCTDT